MTACKELKQHDVVFPLGPVLLDNKFQALLCYYGTAYHVASFPCGLAGFSLCFRAPFIWMVLTT